MANEWKKDFNVMLRDDKGMPKVEIVIDPNTIRTYGGKRMYFAPPLEYDRVMGQAQEGMAATLGELRAYFARKSGTDFTEPITAGVFVSIAAWASGQRGVDGISWWRALKAKGE